MIDFDPHGPWPVMDELLTKLWADELTTQEIANKIGVTKGSVIGRARRIGLPGRKSPIVRSEPNQSDPSSPNGKRYGTREVIGKVPSYTWKNQQWVVRCDCGFVEPVNSFHITDEWAEAGCPQCAPKADDPVQPGAAPTRAETEAPLVEFRAIASAWDAPISAPRVCDFVTHGSKPFQKCGEPVIPGKPYCHAHSLICIKHKLRGGGTAPGYAP